MKRLVINLMPVKVKFYDLKSGKVIEKPEKAYIRDICYDKFMRIYNHFKTEFNCELIFTDMFRTQKEQIAIYKDRLLHPEKGQAARPCLSAHLYGHAFDINTHLFKGFSYRYFIDYAFSCGFKGISTETWHFQYMTQNSNNFYDEILYMCRPFLPMTMEEIYDNLEFAGYSRNTQGIIAFQRDVGLKEDGIAGQQTQVRLILFNTKYNFLEDSNENKKGN